MRQKKLILQTMLLFSILVAALMIGAYSSAQQRDPLNWGSSGSAVREVQQRLSNWGYFTGPIDGIYGATTYKAVLDFQRKNGLPVDGVCGAGTFNALGMPSTTGSSAPAGYQPTKGVSVSGDTMLLARAISAEAESEPYIGKVAVGAVLLNRVSNPAFPKTLSAVVYQGRALESVSNGRVNIEPNDDSVRAARDAINGWDPTYGCLYFWNPSKPVSAWIWTRKIVVELGSHVFAK